MLSARRLRACPPLLFLALVAGACAGNVVVSTTSGSGGAGAGGGAYGACNGPGQCVLAAALGQLAAGSPSHAASASAGSSSGSSSSRAAVVEA